MIWNESLCSPIIEFFGLEWKNYLNSNAPDHLFNVMTKLTISIFSICSITLFTIQKTFRTLFLWMTTIVLFLLALASAWEQNFRIGMLLEHCIQFGTPALFLLSPQSLRTSRIGLLLIALTFLGHGLYAIGFYPQPGYFVDMFINTIQVNEFTAKTLLKSAGILDIVLIPPLFHPKLRRYALIYFTIWGFLTAFARVWANVYEDFFFENLHQWGWQFILRIPHGLIPLAFLMQFSKEKYRS
jgi:hypothetical protein